MSDAVEQISAMPTKQFFVDMLIRDIPLERAVLDLVDNCIDGAKRLRDPDGGNYEGLNVRIVANQDEFRIEDNCGGFDVDTAKDYAFRFGRPKDARPTPFSIGQFGVGMKRALFKFGREFEIRSATTNQRWAVKVDVDKWEETTAWSFDFDFSERDAAVPTEEIGTSICVRRLRPEVSVRFGTSYFQNQLGEMIRLHQRQFISNGLEMRLGGTALTATNLAMLTGTVQPSVDAYDEQVGDERIAVRIVSGVGPSSPLIAGWYVVCNGRVVFAADKTDATGWNRLSENEVNVPKYHNQFARFRGVAYFDCTAADALPWNTTKTGVDADSPVWRRALSKMIDQTRIVIDFLNDLDAETAEQGRSGPIARALAAAQTVQVDQVRHQAEFKAPDRERFSGPVMRKIAYSKPEEQLDTLMERLGLGTAKAVGEQTFDLVYRDQTT